jgi:hypothetical protein
MVDTLKGQVQPLTRDKVEARTTFDRRLIGVDQPVEFPLFFEGDVPGVEPGSGPPAWPPPPMVTEFVGVDMVCCRAHSEVGYPPKGLQTRDPRQIVSFLRCLARL